MKPDKRLLLLPLLVHSVGLALADDSLTAGSRHRCVPNADRTGWECSGASQSAAAPSESEAPVSEPDSEPEATTSVSEPTPPPPSMVAAPPDEAAPLSDFYRAVPETEPSAAPLPETVLAEPQAISTAGTEPAPEASAEPVSDEPASPMVESAPVAEPVSEPVAVAPEPVAEPVPEPAPVSTPEPIAAAPEAVPAPAEPAAVSATWSLSDLASAREFAGLNGNAYTLQLADAGSPNDFPRLIAELGLAPASCYVLKVKRDGQDWWLLAHGEFADANTAKALLARLPNVPGLTRNWPRKIQYLQREFGNTGP